MNQKTNIETKDKPSETVDIFLPDGKVLTGPRGAKVEVFLKALPDWEERQIQGAIINGGLRELSYPINIESHVKPIGMSRSGWGADLPAFPDLSAGSSL